MVSTSQLHSSAAMTLITTASLSPTEIENIDTGELVTGLQAPILALRVDTDDLEPWIAERADLRHDGVIDWRDIALFEHLHGLPDTLSSTMRAHAPR